MWKRPGRSWDGRIGGLTILYVLFLGLFALNVFGEGHTFWQTLVPLLMHLIPNVLVLALLLLAWRWEWIGAVAFAGSGLFYIIWAWANFISLPMSSSRAPSSW